MVQRIGGHFTESLALQEVMGGVEMCAGISPFATAPLEVMHQRIDVQRRYIGIGLQIILGVEEAGFGQQIVFAE